MILSARHRFSTHLTAADFIAEQDYHLKDDGVGMSELLELGTFGFGFAGSDMDAFLREALTALYRMGGRPKDFDYGTKRWFEMSGLGDDAETVARSLVDAWIAAGRPKVEFYDGFRFRLAEEHYHPNSSPAGA